MKFDIIYQNIDWFAARAKEKQVSREQDAQKLKNGLITPKELQEENNFFKGIDCASFEIIAIGNKKIKSRND